MKGLSQLLTHSLLLSFALIILISVVITFNTLEKDYSKFSENITAYNVCLLLKEYVHNLVEKTPEVNVVSEEKYGFLILNLPKRIGRGKYRINFNNNKIEIDTEHIRMSCNVTQSVFPLISVSGGRIKIWKTYVNGTTRVYVKNV